MSIYLTKMPYKQKKGLLPADNGKGRGGGYGDLLRITLFLKESLGSRRIVRSVAKDELCAREELEEARGAGGKHKRKLSQASAHPQGKEVSGAYSEIRLEGVAIQSCGKFVHPPP